MSAPSPALLTSNPVVAAAPAASAASAPSPRSPKATAAAQPYRVVVDCDSHRNCLVVPGLLGDPFTCFDADERAGYLVTGTAIGSVCLWRLDHVAAVMLGDSAAVDSLSDSESEEVVARVLTTSSDEGVKQIFIKDQQSVRQSTAAERVLSAAIAALALSLSLFLLCALCLSLSPLRIFALIGDVHVKIWGSWHDPSSQMKKFDRVHEYKSCKEAYTLLGGERNSKVLVVTVGASEGVRLDLESMVQSACSIRIPSHSTPCAYDGRELLVMQVLQSGCKLLQIWRTEGGPSGDKLSHTLAFEKSAAFYWGFQMVDRPAAAASAAAAAADGEQKENGSAAAASASAVPSASASASAAPAASASTRYLAYVSHFVSVKLIPYTALPGALDGDVSDLVASSPEIRSHGAAGRASHRIHAATRSGSRILAFLIDGSRGLVYTLSSDSKLKVFALDSKAARGAGMDSKALRDAGVKDDTASSSSAAAAAWAPGKSPSPGILLRKYRGLLGTFKLGYPYILKRIGERLMLYSADEGIFLLRL